MILKNTFFILKNSCFGYGHSLRVSSRYRLAERVTKGDKMVIDCRRYEWTRRFFVVSLGMLMSTFLALPGRGDDEWLSTEDLKKLIGETFEAPKDGKLLDRENRIWINRDEQVVVLDGYVVQREVPLELFACPAGSKEHEAVVAVLARARSVHAGLLAINAKPGSPASFEPFKPATGTTVRVYVLWLDENKKPNGTLAQNWIRRMDNKKAMHWDWVFAGSKMYKDEEGKEHYLGDSGELISVSNFTTSTMDVAVQSDQSNANLMFEAFKERIPKRNTPIRIVLALTDETPFGSSPDNPIDKDKSPKFLSEKVPDRIMQYLVPKKK